MVDIEIANAVINIQSAFISRKKRKLSPSHHLRIGRSPGLSHTWEEQVAIALQNSAISKGKNYTFFLDYPISPYDKHPLKSGAIRKHSQPIYPDIFVVEGLDMSPFQDYVNAQGDIDEKAIDSQSKNGKKSISLLNEGKLVAIVDVKIDFGFLDLNTFKSPHGSYWKREQALIHSKYWKCNYLVGAYGPVEQKLNDILGPIIIHVPNYQEVQKFEITLTEENDHRRIPSFQRLMKSSYSNHNLLFLLDCKNHPAGAGVKSSNRWLISHFRNPKRSSYTSIVSDNITTLNKLDSIF